MLLDYSKQGQRVHVQLDYDVPFYAGTTAVHLFQAICSRSIFSALTYLEPSVNQAIREE